MTNAKRLFFLGLVLSQCWLLIGHFRLLPFAHPIALTAISENAPRSDEFDYDVDSTSRAWLIAPQATRHSSYASHGKALNFISPWFEAAPPLLVDVVGSTEREEASLAIEIERHSGERSTIHLTDPSWGKIWHVWQPAVPFDVARVRLLATDTAKTGEGFAFTDPYTLSRGWPLLQIFLCSVFALTILVGPGVLLVSALRALPRKQADSDFAWLVAGPLLSLAIATIAWSLVDRITPTWLVGILLQGVVAAMAVGVFLQPSDLRLAREEGQALILLALAISIAIGKTIYAPEQRGNLHGASITRSMEADGRSDPRIPYLVAMAMGNRWTAFGVDSRRFYAPTSMKARGPVAGAIVAPLVLVSSSTAMPNVDPMAELWVPFDRYGFMAFRLFMIVLSALALPLVFALVAQLSSRTAALVAAILIAPMPFFIHEMYFTWAKQAAAVLGLASVLFILRGRSLFGGFCFGLAYITHPLVSFTLPFLPVLAAFSARGSSKELREQRPASLLDWRQALLGARGALAVVAGVALVLVPWRFLGTGQTDSFGAFLQYFYMAQGQYTPDLLSRAKSRLDSLLGTLIPFVPFGFFRHQVPMLPIFDTPSAWVQFFNCYMYCFPLGMGLTLSWSLRRELFSLFRRPSFLVFVLVLMPFLIFWIYWGITITGLMREGLHLGFYLLLAFWIAGLDRSVSVPRVWRLLPWRSLELLLVLLVPVFATNAHWVQRAYFVTDLVALFLMVGGAVALAVLGRRWVGVRFGAAS